MNKAFRYNKEQVDIQHDMLKLVSYKSNYFDLRLEENG